MNCIDPAIKAASGKLTEKEILDAFEQEGKIREAFIKAGLSPVKAIRALWEGSQRSFKGARENGYAQGQAHEAKWIGLLMAMIEKDRPLVM